MKIFVFAVLAVVAVSAESTCEPGKAFKYYCNDCTCGPDGLAKSAACTRQECVPGMWNEDGSLKQPLSDPVPREKRQASGTIATCVPGKSFKQYCNTCYCPDSGDRSMAICTLVGCPNGVYNEDGTLVNPDPTPRKKRQANGAEATCVPGTTFNRFCNSCECPFNGDPNMAICTEMACDWAMWNEDGSLKQPRSDPVPRDRRQAKAGEATCEPGKPFKYYCNNCRCGTDGLVKSAACTKMACIDGIFNEDGSLKQPPSDPIPREKRQASGTCVPGESFKHYCNTCRCPDNGDRNMAACTRKGCADGVYNEDGTLVNPDHASRKKRQADGAPALTCVPGIRFKHFCNTCLCPYNGDRNMATCTVRGCDRAMWNEDGSLKQPLRDRVSRDRRQANASEPTCEPGKRFKYYCNKCRCRADGLVRSAACTKMACFDGYFNQDGSLRQPPSDPIPREKRQASGTCVPGESFKQYCNTCRCPDNGDRNMAACTRKGCADGVYNEDGTLVNPDHASRKKRQADGAPGATCVPGTDFKRFCNTCHCPIDGDRSMAFCMRKRCPDGVYNEDGTLVNPDHALRKKRQADGAPAVTCVPGMSFKHFCNTCRCPSNGDRNMAACTYIGCPQGVYDEDGTLANTRPEPRNKRQTDGAGGPEATCVPGTTFNNSCNTCRCGPDGLRKSAVCTKAFCLDDKYDELGHPQRRNLDRNFVSRLDFPNSVV